MNQNQIEEYLRFSSLLQSNSDFKAQYKALTQHIVSDYGIRSMNPIIINRKTDKHQYKEYIKAIITHANTY